MNCLYLNGRTSESAMVSLAAILSLSPMDMLRKMRMVDASGLEADELEQLLADLFLKDWLPEFSVVWFHGARLLRNHTVMTEGLLHHVEAKKKLRSVLIGLAGGLERVGESPFATSATFKPMSEGPFGMLFRASVAVPLGSNGHYIHDPELVNDMAGGMLGENYRALTARFAEISDSCIVHFVAPPTEAVLPKALRFVYETQIEGADEAESANSCVTCFDGDGVPIPPDRILKIEMLTSRHVPHPS